MDKLQVAEEETKGFLVYLFWISGLLVVSPFCLHWFGFDFSSHLSLSKDFFEENTQNLSEYFHQAASGLYVHTIFTWSTVTTAFLMTMLAILHFSVRGEGGILLVGLAFLLSGMLDAFQMFAMNGFILEDLSNPNFIPLSWTVSRLAHSFLIVWGVSRIGKESQVNLSLNQWGVVALFTLLSVMAIAYGATYYCATTELFSDSLFSGELFSSPWNYIVLALFATNTLLLWGLYTGKKEGIFVFSLVMASVVELALESHMLFGAGRLYDTHFNIAHGLKAFVYLIPFVGMCMRYMSIYKQEAFIREQLLDYERVMKEKVNTLADVNKRLVKSSKAAENAKEASRTKSHFLAKMSHELRTPLNAIIGYSELLKEDIECAGEGTELSPYQMLGDLGKINQAGTHLLGMINNVLDLSKIEAGKEYLTIEEIDICMLCKESLDPMAVLATNRNNELHLNATQDLGKMKGDGTKIRQILINLLGNACKFTENGEIHLSAERISGGDQEEIVFSVRDTGEGMTPEESKRVFGAFEQVEDSASQAQGSGLGLTIASEFIRLMGGGIVCESEKGQGTTFTVTLPAKPGKELAGYQSK